jgi:hypothetical protein
MVLDDLQESRSQTSVRGLRLGVDQRRDGGIGHSGAAHVEQKIEDLG